MLKTREPNAALRAVSALGSGATPERVRTAIDACIGVMGPPTSEAAFAAIAKLARRLAPAERGPALDALGRLADGGPFHLSQIAHLASHADRRAAIEATVAAALAPKDDADPDALIDRTRSAISAVAVLEPALQAGPVAALTDRLPASLTASAALRVGAGLRELSDAGAQSAFERRSRFAPDAALVLASCTARASDEVETAWAGIVAAYARHLTAATVFRSLAALVERADSARLASFERTFPDLHAFDDQVRGPLAAAWAGVGDAAMGYRVASTIQGAPARVEARVAVVARSSDEALRSRLALDLAAEVGIASHFAAREPRAVVRALGDERSLAFATREDVSIAARAELLAQLPAASALAETLFDRVRGDSFAVTLDDLFAMGKLALPAQHSGELLCALLTRMLRHDPRALFFDDGEGHDLGALAPLLVHLGGAELLTASIVRVAA